MESLNLFSSSVLSASKTSIEHFYDGDSFAPRSPWGHAQVFVQYDGNRLGEASTAGHGGMFVRGEWAKKIPYYFRRTWYEEDCECAIVLYYLYDDLKALQEDFVRCGISYPSYSCLNYIGRHTKDEVYTYFLGMHRATLDFHTKQTAQRCDFDSDARYERYIEQLNQLKSSAQKLKASITIKDGDVIEFENPIYFQFGSREISAKQFTVVKHGRATRFRPIGLDLDFIAQIRRWRSMDFKLFA